MWNHSWKNSRLYSARYSSGIQLPGLLDFWVSVLRFTLPKWPAFFSLAYSLIWQHIVWGLLVQFFGRLRFKHCTALWIPFRYVLHFRIMILDFYTLSKFLAYDTKPDGRTPLMVGEEMFFTFLFWLGLPLDRKTWINHVNSFKVLTGVWPAEINTPVKQCKHHITSTTDRWF